MTILICCPYPLDTPGGVGGWVRQFYKELKRQRQKVFIVGPQLPDGRKNPVDFELGRMFTIQVEDNYIEMTITRNFERAKKILEKVKPDIVNFQDIGASSFLSIALVFASFEINSHKRPIFVTTCHSQNDKWTWQVKAIITFFKSLRLPKLWKNAIPIGITPSAWETVSSKTEGRIAVSKSTARSWNNLEKSDFEIIPNGIDFSDLYPSPGIIENWKKDGKKIILFTGRHDVKKGVKDLIKAYGIISKEKSVRGKVKLIIVGNGHLTEELKERAKGLNIEFYDFLPRSELVKAYHTADIFTSPSTGREAFGRTLAEALVCGKIVVATRISGYKEWLDKKPFALLAKPANPEDLAKKLLEALELGEKKRKELGIAGSKYVRENFSIKKITRRNIEYFKKCIADHKEKENNEYEDYVFPWTHLRPLLYNATETLNKISPVLLKEEKEN